MEPIEYLKIAKRHWLMIVLLVAAAMAIVFWTSPERESTSYEATHVMLVESSQGQGSQGAANPQVVALWTTVGQVPVLAAEALGYEGEPAELAQQVTATADRDLGTVSITATDENPDRAELIADTFADQVVLFLKERDTAQAAEDNAAADAREAELRQAIDELDAQIADEPANVDTLTGERDALIRQRDEVLAAPDRAADPVTYTTLQQAAATPPEEGLPGTRSREQRMLLAGLVALVLGFGLAIMLDRSDTRLRTRRDAEGRFGLPVIAEIPMLSLPNRRRKVMVAEDPDSIKAEAYRTLRAAVMLYRRRDDPTLPRPRHERITDARAGISGNGRRGRVDREVILITSPGAGDGKTTTVANLAGAYAESGRSVLVLSCDLWRSGVARRFGVKAGRGISDYLASDDAPPLSSFVRDTSVPGVRIVTGGLSIHRPGGRLIAEQRLVDEARELADVVILDTAPLLSASLTRELTTVVDAVVIVCRVGRTTVSEAERCADLLEQLGAPALGVVLVGVTARPFSDYFAYASPRRTRRVVAEADDAMADEAMATEIFLDGTEQPNGSAPGSRRRGSGSGGRSTTTGSDELSGESR